MVLGEPTNDLDLETLELLQERLAEYPGTVLMVSHDRDFLDRVMTSVVASEGNGRWVEYAGGYTDMLAQRPAASAASPAALNHQRRPALRDKAPAAVPSRRMSYNDSRALEMLPARIASLQSKIEALNGVLADADLYVRDPARFNTTTFALAAARNDWPPQKNSGLRLRYGARKSRVSKALVFVRSPTRARSHRAIGVA